MPTTRTTNPTIPPTSPPINEDVIREFDKRENDVVLLNESGEFDFEGVDCGEFGVVGMNDGKLTVGAFGGLLGRNDGGEEDDDESCIGGNDGVDGGENCDGGANTTKISTTLENAFSDGSPPPKNI